jgi:serine/threonine-protein kinase
MAPEVARGRSDIDARADVFGVGAVMYRGLTGSPPFGGEGLGKILSAVMAHDIQPVLERRPGLPRPVVECVERAMAHDPDARYPSAAEMNVAIQEIIDQG